MCSTENFDVDEYRAELECQDDETLFGESELAKLAETRMNALVEGYEEELDTKDMAELYGDDEWERIRAEKIEELVETREDATGSGNDKAAFRRAYQELAKRGKCDSWGGAESKRVWREWLEAGKPLSLEAFITERANAMPSD